jgi:hypothetical protein
MCGAGEIFCRNRPSFKPPFTPPGVQKSMSNLAIQSGYLAWLRALLLEQRGAVKNLLCRLSFLGTPGSLTPSAFGKFLGMLKQIAAEQENEKDIISRIHEVEYRHRSQRRCRRLKPAGPAKKKTQLVDRTEPPPRKSDSNFVMLVAFLAFIGRRRPKPGK